MGSPASPPSISASPVWQGLAFGRVGRGESGQGSSLAPFRACESEDFEDKPAWGGECPPLPFPGAQAFGAILNLVPLAESVVKLNAVCMECFREAAYTKRLGMEKEVPAARLLRGCGAAWRG